MKTLLAAMHAARASGQPVDLAFLSEAFPYSSFMGFVFEIHEAELRAVMRYDPMLIGNPSLPALHGGTVGALLETAAIVQLMWQAETALLPKTINITVDYLRPGRPRDTFARAVVTRHGRRVVNVHAEAWQEDQARPIATANAHFLVMPDEGPADASPASRA